MTEIVPVRITISRAQRAVLVELTRDGANNKVIANRLGLSEDTIKSHIKAVLAKLPHINDRCALAVALLRRSVITKTLTQPGAPPPGKQPGPQGESLAS